MAALLGRQVFMDALVAHGVTRIFGNPGTTESPLLDSLADYPSIEYTVALHEGVALGAASFYATAAKTTGVVNLHVAPGLGNAIGMLYCALKSGTPMIVTAGQQDTRMRLKEPVLGHELTRMAAPVTKWSVQAERADELADIMRRAFKIAHEEPTGPVFVALPIDVLEQETMNGAHTAGHIVRMNSASPEGVDAALKLLTNASSPAIIASDDVAKADAFGPLVRISEQLGAPVWYETLRHRIAFPTSHPNAKTQLPVDAQGVRKMLGNTDVALLLGGPFFEDVWFAEGSPFPEQCKVIHIESSNVRVGQKFPIELGLVGDLALTLSALTDGLDVSMSPAERTAAETRNLALSEAKQASRAKYADRVDRARSRSPMAVSVAMQSLANALPDDVVVVDESITASYDVAENFRFDEPDSYFSGRGGGIGQGLPGALGTQLGLPDKRVVCISGDGSAMYSIQSLWTAARYDLPIVFVILANAEYRILKHNLDFYRQRFETGTNRPYVHMDLGIPKLGFVEMASSMGVDGELAIDEQSLRAAVDRALSAKRPYLIEVAIEGKR